MSSSFVKQLLSPQFVFLIGPDREPVSVHAQVMAGLSQPFDRLINGPMKEAQEMCADLSDIELEIFLRLAEFAYRGDYTMRPCPYDDAELVEKDMEWLTARARFWNLIDNAERKNILKRCNGHKSHEELDNVPLASRWPDRNYLPRPNSHPRGKIAHQFSPGVLRSENDNHKPLFLAHAKLYCLADRYLIPGLKDLALQKLHKTLVTTCSVGFLQNEAHILDILALLSYAYSNENTPDRGAGGRTDSLRQEVLEFVVVHIDYLDGTTAFEKLLEDEGQFPVDLVRLLNKERRNADKR